MRTLLALFALAAVGWAQDEGRERRPRDGSPEAIQAKIADLEKRLADSQGEGRERVQQEISRLRAQLEEMRKGRPESPEGRRRPPPEGREGDPPFDPDRARKIDELDQRRKALMESMEKLERGSAAFEEKQRELHEIEGEIGRLSGPPGRPPGRDRRPPPREGDMPFNPEEVRAWLRENEPETFARLQRMQDEGRARGPEIMDTLRAAQGRMREMTELKQRDPRGFARLAEVRKMEAEQLGLAEKIRQASPEEKAKLMPQLTELVGKLFDAREEMRTRELGELKRRVEDLEKGLQDRKAARSYLVEQRRKELLGEPREEER